MSRKIAELFRLQDDEKAICYEVAGHQFWRGPTRIKFAEDGLSYHLECDMLHVPPAGSQGAPDSKGGQG